MIGYLKGEITGIYEQSVLLEVGGVGYRILMPQSAIAQLRGLSEQVKIYTYLHVREDAMQLFGFFTQDDLDFFKLLLQVNGIGPKGALSILSVMPTDELKFAILSADAKTISKCPGIGAKTAQRMIIELKDKMNLMDAFEKKLEKTEAKEDAMSTMKQEAVEALTSLGYSATDALRAVKSSDISDEDDVETILKKALKVIALS